MQRIVVSVSNDLMTDQRVAKVCTSLADSNYDVHLIGRYSHQPIESERSYAISRIKVPFSKGFLFYASLNIQLFFSLLFRKKDILVANDLDTLLPNFLVSKLQGKPLVFDSHELFSEIPELVHRPITKSFWKFLETWMLSKINYGYTVSDAIARHYENEYGVHFTVIRNVPLKTSNKHPEIPLDIPENKPLILYQGAINVGRGLELIIDAMQNIDRAILLLVGDGDILDKLKEKVDQLHLESKVFFYGKCRPEVLKAISPKAAIGISLEEDLGLNYRYALPNKVFDYIHAKVPVLVSDLPEMKTLVEHYQIGQILKLRTAEALTLMINKMLDQTKAPYLPALAKAADDLNWEKEQKPLLKIFEGIG